MLPPAANVARALSKLKFASARWGASRLADEHLDEAVDVRDRVELLDTWEH